MWYIIPDVHGRDNWKEQLHFFNPDVDSVIFLGDYLDPYPGEVSKEDAICNFESIIDFKNKYKEKVILLIGNHDCPYIFPEYKNSMSYLCRFDSEHYKDIENLFKETEFKFTHTINVNDKTVLFSHAGVLDDWYNLKDISELEEFCKTNLIRLCEVSRYRGGIDSCGSIVWADVYEHVARRYNNNSSIFQIFGHTYSKVPILTSNFAMLDAGSKYYAILDRCLLRIRDSSFNTVSTFIV